MWLKYILDMSKAQEIMTCPWCGVEDFVDEIVFRHTEAHGHIGINGRSARCTKCDKVIDMDVSFRIAVIQVKKSKKKMGDWG